MLLRLLDVAHFYGPRLIFRDISLELSRGTVTLLAGANGAGKSTLLKIIAGLIRPASGQRLPGESGTEPDIGYLGHQTFLYPGLSALENLRFWGALNGLRLSENELLTALERMELAAFAEEKAGGFSRGMAQRLNLARVFLRQPDLLLLDEPGTGLDSRSSAVLHKEIAAAASSGTGVVWISHSLERDLPLADRVLFLGDKGMVFSGNTEEYAAFTLSDQAGDGAFAAQSSDCPAERTRQKEAGAPC